MGKYPVFQSSNVYGKSFSFSDRETKLAHAWRFIHICPSLVSDVVVHVETCAVPKLYLKDMLRLPMRIEPCKREITRPIIARSSKIYTVVNVYC